MKSSCIIPNYNGGKKLIKCVKLCLTYADEVIVVDDCSTDSSVKLLHSIKNDKLRIFKNPVNSGASYSRNFGFGKARYSLLLFVDSDCYLNRNNFRKLLKYKADIIYPKIINIDETIYNRFKAQTYLQNSVCFLMKKKTFKKMGGFDEKIKFYMDDVEFFFRCYKSELSDLYAPESEGFHDAVISKGVSSKKFFLNIKNTTYFCLKHHRGVISKGFPTWITILVNMRRCFLNRDRLYNQPLAKTKIRAFGGGLKAVWGGFIIYFYK